MLAAAVGSAVVLWWLTSGEPPDLPAPSDGSWRTVPNGFRDPLSSWGWRAVFDDVAIVFGALAMWTALLWARARRAGETLGVDWLIRPNHAVQSTMQLLILAYWAVYWPDLGRQAPLVFIQLAFTWWVEALLSWALHGRWRVTIGAVPIVLSTNLFFLFQGPNFRCFFLIFAIAQLSKLYLRRQGSHIFNPSALGMSVLSLAFIVGSASPGLLAPRFVAPLPIFHAFSLPPNMLEWLFLLGLLSQARFPYVLITLGAFVGFSIPLGEPTPLYLFEPAIFIAILFLIPDPKTSPRSPIAQYLFGFAYALVARGLDPVLTAIVGWDGDAKILAVPIINLMVPVLERVGARLDQTLGTVFEPRFNLVHLAFWAFIGASSLRSPVDKSARFALNAEVPRDFFNPWVKLDDDQQTCALNPVWCTPFSFLGEVELWTTSERTPYRRVIPHQHEAPPTK